MPKIVLTDIVSGYQLKEAYNANNDAIAAAIENTLSRDGTTPNQMEAELDMNSNKITNVANGTASKDAVNYEQLQAVVLSGGVITDHGLLDGLADDDHTQYHTAARADTWLGTKTTTNLTEGTNLYYTDGRADARVAASAPAVITSTVDKTFVDALNVDADTLDGVDSTGFALAGHTHTPAYAPPAIATEAGLTRTAIPADANQYTRFTNADAKTYTFTDVETYVVGSEFFGRNVGTADLTLTAGGAMVLNAPAGGTLVVPQGGSFAVKIVGASEADVTGYTVAA